MIIMIIQMLSHGGSALLGARGLFACSSHLLHNLIYIPSLGGRIGRGWAARALSGHGGSPAGATRLVTRDWRCCDCTSRTLYSTCHGVFSGCSPGDARQGPVLRSRVRGACLRATSSTSSTSSTGSTSSSIAATHGPGPCRAEQGAGRGGTAQRSAARHGTARR